VTTIELELLNWDKYNPRKDLKATTWMRFQNSIYEDPQFFDFDHGEICFWIYLLCMASKKQSSTVIVNITHAERIGRFKKSTIDSCIEKLKHINCVTERHAHVTSTLRARHTTNERTEQNMTNVTNDTHATRARYAVEKNAENLPTDKSGGSKVWDRYREQFVKRYGVEPMRNAKVNAQCKQLYERLGESGIGAIDFYLTHNDSWYLKNQHDLGSLLAKAESIFTQWQRGHAVTSAQVRDAEKVIHKNDIRSELDNLFTEAK
jgi:hypothetical protein